MMYPYYFLKFLKISKEKVNFFLKKKPIILLFYVMKSTNWNSSINLRVYVPVRKFYVNYLLYT